MGDSPASILYDSGGTEKGTAGNPVKVDPTGSTAQPVTDGGGSLTVDQSVIPNPTDTTGTISALNGTVAATVQGWSSCAVVITGTWVATLVFEMSHDGGTTWTAGGFVASPAVAAPFPVLSMLVTANGSYQTIGMGPTTNVRIRAAAYTSGTVGIRLVFSDALPAMLTSFSAIHQNVRESLTNSSTANLAGGAFFTGAAESTAGNAGIQVNVIADQPISVKVQQSSDGTNWDIEDEQVFLAEEGDGRIFQSTSAFFRVIATNLSGITTTYLRLHVAMCPIVEVVPKALTPSGKLRLTSMTTSWAPAPYNFQDRTSHRALLMDLDRNLNVRARCLTDEASFRDDFTAGDIYTDLTGTVYFTNGSDVVTGVGTAFQTELNIQKYLKRSTHADTAYAPIAEILSDEVLYLSEPYSGATSSGTGRFAQWKYAIGTGGAITQTGSEILLASGTTDGTLVQALRYGDYLPYVIGFRARITQRIANQEAHIGMSDADIGSMESQALVVFDGTTNTTVKLRTSSSSADVETTIVTLPDGGVTSALHYYQLEITANRVILFIDDVKVAEHKLHIPGPYDSMNCHICIQNTGVPGSTTTLAGDTYYFTNFDRIEVTSGARGDSLTVKELRASVPAVTSVAAAVADTALLVPNPNRLGCSIYNDSIAALYLKLGSGASTTSFTIALGRYDYYEAPANYVGRINGYWSAATGSARITELT